MADDRTDEPQGASGEIWRRIRARGEVQGVGFRPAIWRHADRCGVRGTVCNTLGGATIVAGGPREAVERFLAEPPAALPPVARLHSLEIEPCDPIAAPGFSIAPSAEEERAEVAIPPDLATCGECLEEILAPTGRRAGYAFTACTQCGPRYTMVEALPYDRERTTMGEFPLCEACGREYDSPADRRFHAECAACPDCGPALEILEARRTAGPRLRGEAAFERAVALLRAGSVGAVKGIGGYHLVCDALQAEPVAALRRRKRRPAKPFALMAAGVEMAERYARVSEAERAILESPERPIVLLAKRAGAPLPEGIAPGNGRVGIMLPYTPLHHLLLARFDLLVMTSANRSEEPIMHTEEEVAPWVGPIVDFALCHNRRIWNRCDDSVALVHGARPTLIRRARGYVPRAIPLASGAPAAGAAGGAETEAGTQSKRAGARQTVPKAGILACGGDLKNVFGLVRGRRVYLSTHMGDLENAAAMENYRAQIERWQRLLDVSIETVVHDLHPGYHSTQFALSLPAGRKIAAQHHHAHLAACLADNARLGPAIGVILDGTGYGADGTVWGGEFLVGGAAGCRRAGHLKPIRMPGAEKAVEEPWRMALAYLADAMGGDEAARFVAARMQSGPERCALLAKALGAGAPFPPTSSAGRMFDALGFLLGCGDAASFEAQHAMAVEAMAADASSALELPFGLREEPDGAFVVEFAPLWRAVADAMDGGAARETIAAGFHRALGRAIAQVCAAVREKEGLDTVACSGGVFLNALIAREAEGRLTQEGFEVLFHRQTPPGDGAIALGQAAIAAAACR